MNEKSGQAGAIIALLTAVRHFRRVWPADAENAIANIMPSLDRTGRRRILAFLRACRDLDIEL